MWPSPAMMWMRTSPPALSWGTVSASDPDAGDSWTYAITDASGNFTIDPNSGEIRTTGALDHEAQDSYTVTIAATDAGGLTTIADGDPQCQ